MSGLIEVPPTEKVLSINEAAEVVPLSTASLYRVAAAGGDDNPFRKRCGRWGTTVTDLLAWWGSGTKGTTRTRATSDPIPPIARRRSTPNSSMRGKVLEMRRKRRVA